MIGQHTPGPWHLVNLPDGQGSWVASTDDGNGLRDDGSHYMAVCVGAVGEPNARLIAAAPDLLEALRKALWMIEAHEGTSDENDAIYDAARAAIAKAEGRS